MFLTPEYAKDLIRHYKIKNRNKIRQIYQAPTHLVTFTFVKYKGIPNYPIRMPFFHSQLF